MTAIEQWKECIKYLEMAEKSLEYDTNSMYETRATIQRLIRNANDSVKRNEIQ